MLNRNPRDVFEENCSDFNFGAAFRTFFSDNLALCLTLLAVSLAATVANGAKGILTHRRVYTVLLVIMVCRAFHAGATANRPRIIIKDVKPETDNDPAKDS